MHSKLKGLANMFAKLLLFSLTYHFLHFQIYGVCQIMLIAQLSNWFDYIQDTTEA